MTHNHNITRAATMLLISTVWLLPFLIAAPFTQTILTWDVEPGVSNRVAWGLARNNWTNSVLVSSNVFFVTNGIQYAVYAIFDGIESIPALWPSNKIERVWVETSTNLITWSNEFIWRTNYGVPQQYLRLKSELIGYE